MKINDLLTFLIISQRLLESHFYLSISVSFSTLSIRRLCCPLGGSLGLGGIARSRRAESGAAPAVSDRQSRQ